ncbi:MAG: LemA family protein [Alphaproteobacteria bacterium]|nr:LemA family protein [Alphaproteobacteria bacterium]
MILFGVGTLLIVAYLVYVYNKGITLKNYVNEAFSVMDVYLKKRWDLVPNLVNIVKGYATYETATLMEIVKNRQSAYVNKSISEKLTDNMKIGDDIAAVLAIAEAYPDLKASQNYITLMQQLTEIENDIAYSRKYYNATVRELNMFVAVFPTNILCHLFRFKPEKMFEIDSAERLLVKIDLSEK